MRGLVRDDAEDVASEAWLQIVRDLATFRGSGADFRRWAATVARHRAIDHLRRMRSRPRGTVIEQDVLDLPAVDDTAGRALETLSTERVLDLVAALPPDQGEAVLLRVVMGLDGPSAAQVLGKRPGAVRAAARRGILRLARQLARPPDSVGPVRRLSVSGGHGGHSGRASLPGCAVALCFFW